MIRYYVKSDACSQWGCEAPGDCIQQLSGNCRDCSYNFIDNDCERDNG